MIFVTIFVIAITLSLYINIAVIKISIDKKIFDYALEERKLHISPTPNLGGIGIFFSFLLMLTFFEKNYLNTISVNYIISSSVILFLMGLKDDLINIPAFNKLFFQILAAFIVAYFANIRITNLNGFFMVYEIPYFFSILITIFFILLVCNSINLIDGIDGLAASQASIASIIFLIIFYYTDQSELILFTIIFLGSIIGFLILNFGKAKIFMGDTGSYLLGFILSIITIIALDKSKLFYNDDSQIAMIFSIFIIPFFDTFRILILRLIKKKSPFAADSNHLHHLLLKKKLNHTHITLILGSLAIIIFILNYFLQTLGNYILLSIDIIIMLIFVYVVKNIKS